MNLGQIGLPMGPAASVHHGIVSARRVKAEPGLTFQKIFT